MDTQHLLLPLRRRRRRRLRRRPRRRRPHPPRRLDLAAAEPRVFERLRPADRLSPLRDRTRAEAVTDDDDLEWDPDERQRLRHDVVAASPGCENKQIARDTLDH